MVGAIVEDGVDLKKSKDLGIEKNFVMYTWPGANGEGSIQ